MRAAQSIQPLQRVWYTYWFNSAPLFDLAICRIIIVGFQIAYLLWRDYFGKLFEYSQLSGSLYDSLPILEILFLPFGWNYRPSFVALAILFWLTLVSGFFSLVGIRTNLSLILFAIGNLIIQAYIYSFGDFHHSQALMIISLIVLALGPAGEVLSLDDLWRRLRHNIKQQRFSSFDVIAKRSHFAQWPIRLIQWIFALVYLSAAVHKLRGSGDFNLDWMNGYTLQFYLIRDGLRWDSDFGVWLGQYHILAVIASWLAILFEGTFFLLLFFQKLVWLYIPLGVLFHTGIYITQRAPFFQYLAIYAVFIPWTDVVKALSRRFAYAKPKPEIFYDGLCPLCIRSMTFLCYFDWFKRLVYSDLETRWSSLAEKHPKVSLEDCRAEMHLLLPDGSVRKGFFAFRAILGYLPPLWPLLLILYFPGAATLGPRIYQFFASRRTRYQRCTFDSCSVYSDIEQG